MGPDRLGADREITWRVGWRVVLAWIMVNAPSLQQEVTAPQLTGLDRCDSCGAQAYHRFTLHAGGVLMFCHHHGQQHAPKLAPAAAEWLDESYKLS